MSKIKIVSGKVFIDGIQTNNPELIGFAVLDMADQIRNSKILNKDFSITYDEPETYKNEVLIKE